MPLPLPFKSDIQPMLNDMGVSVTIGGATAKALVDDADETIAGIFDGNRTASVLIGRAVIVKADRDAFPAAAQGVAAVVDYPAAGTAYTVVSVRRELQLTLITCAKV